MVKGNRAVLMASGWGITQLGFMALWVFFEVARAQELPFEPSPESPSPLIAPEVERRPAFFRGFSLKVRGYKTYGQFYLFREALDAALPAEVIFHESMIKSGEVTFALKTSLPLDKINDVLSKLQVEGWVFKWSFSQGAHGEGGIFEVEMVEAPRAHP